MCSSERHIGTFFVLFRTRMVGFCFRFFGSFFLAQNWVGRCPRCGALGARNCVSDGPLEISMKFQSELELELIQTHMRQKPMLGEGAARRHGSDRSCSAGPPCARAPWAGSKQAPEDET